MYEADKPKMSIGKSSEAVMRARAYVAFERGRYRELYNIIETREFASKYHGQLQDMWYRAHYKEAEGVRGRALGKLTFLSILQLTFWEKINPLVKAQDILLYQDHH